MTQQKLRFVIGADIDSGYDLRLGGLCPIEVLRVTRLLIDQIELIPVANADLVLPAVAFHQSDELSRFKGGQFLQMKSNNKLRRREGEEKKGGGRREGGREERVK